MITTENVKQFYDNFSKNILINEFYNYSLRQDAIKKLCRKYIAKNSRILEIGCGVGLITKFVQQKASSVLSIDISEINVETAKLYAEAGNTHFEVVDITKETDKIKSYGPFDAILIFDVIEHIETENYKNLFNILENLLSPGGIVLISYPAPEYQDYLKAQKPEALQVIDQTLELSDILTATKLKPYYFSYRHIWAKDQYIHLVLKKKIEYPVNFSRGLWNNFSYRVKKYSWRYSHIFFKRKVNGYFSKK